MYVYMCVTLRNAIYFYLHPVRGLVHPVCMPWLYGHPRPAGNDMDSEPGMGDGKPGPMMVRLAGTTGYSKPSTGDSKSGTRDGASGTTGYGKPGTGVSLVPVMLQIETQEIRGVARGGFLLPGYPPPPPPGRRIFFYNYI